MFTFLTKTDWADKPGVYLLVASSGTSDLFIATLRQRIAQEHERAQEVLALPNAVAAMSAVNGKLQQTFLGSSMRYWVHTPSPWQAKLKKQWFATLAEYQGPHTILMAMSEDDAGYFVGKKQVQRIALPETVSPQTLVKLSTALGHTRAARALKERRQLIPTGLLTLDQACQLLLHLEFMPLRSEAVVANYLGKMVPESSTLLEVSDLFFRRQWDRFFTVWRRLTDEYSDMFWVAFFTEQVWRAYYVQRALKKSDHALARRLSFRLPASYATRTWRQSSPQELLQLYEQLYFFDTRVKRGSSFSMNDFLLTTSYVSGRQE